MAGPRTDEDDWVADELQPLTSQLLSVSREARDLERASFSRCREDLDADAAPRWLKLKGGLVGLAVAGCVCAALKSPLSVAVHRPWSGRGPNVQLLAESFASVRNWGKDCSQACHGAGKCEDFCGEGNACCKFGDDTDAPECKNIMAWGSLSFYTCVTPGEEGQVVPMMPQGDAKVKNYGKDCWGSCREKSGYCPEYCGEGNACCRYGLESDVDECKGISEWSSKDFHTCVVPVVRQYTYTVETSSSGMASGMSSSSMSSMSSSSSSSSSMQVGGHSAATSTLQGVVKNFGFPCLSECGGKAGLCADFCGESNACCKYGSMEDPPECHGTKLWGITTDYTCVSGANGNQIETLEAQRVTFSTPREGVSIMNWGADCLATCHESGYCEKFCGRGNACCKYGSTLGAAECRGITRWGATDHYTCVAPEAEQYMISQVAMGAQGSKVQHWGENCWEACGSRPGACPDFCGVGNACCRFGERDDPMECAGIWDWGSKETYTCVATTNLALYVNHFGEDCMGPCKGAGFCEAWCGSGNACCKFGDSTDPDECKGVPFFPTWSHHTCVKAAGYEVEVPLAAQADECKPGEVKDDSGKCVESKHAEKMTMYMYFPSNDLWPILRDAKLGNLGGVMWYLHKQVVDHCPRKDQINRIIRYVVTVRNPASYFNAMKKQFGPFDGEYDETYGKVVGCAQQPTDGPDNPDYETPVLFSLPGGQYIGGECVAPDGERTCTWRADYAGEVRLDEVSGISDNNLFCHRGYVEYNGLTDKGNGTNFWNFRNNITWGKHRTHYIKELFKNKYPNWPEDIGEPRCDNVV